MDPSDKKKDNMEWQQVPMKKGNFVETGQAPSTFQHAEVSQGAMEVEQDGHGVRVGLEDSVEHRRVTEVRIVMVL